MPGQRHTGEAVRYAIAALGVASGRILDVGRRRARPHASRWPSRSPWSHRSGFLLCRYWEGGRGDDRDGRPLSVPLVTIDR